MVIEKMKKGVEKILGKSEKPSSPEVLEVGVKEGMESKQIILQIFTLEKFSDTENVLAGLRGGDKIAMVKIRPLREKDMTELKRAINRLKTHCAATGGDMAAIDDNWVLVVPPIVGIEKSE